MAHDLLRIDSSSSCYSLIQLSDRPKTSLHVWIRDGPPCPTSHVLCSPKALTISLHQRSILALVQHWHILCAAPTVPDAHGV